MKDADTYTIPGLRKPQMKGNPTEDSDFEAWLQSLIETKKDKACKQTPSATSPYDSKS